MSERQPRMPFVQGPLPPHDPVTGELLFADGAASPPPSASSRAAGAEEKAAIGGGAAPPVLASRGLGGFSPRELAAMALLAVLLLWAAWATRELMLLKDRRTISVSLATMVQEFVASEARRGASQQDAAARTKAYLTAIDGAMRALSEDGTTILVSEAVLGNSVPDVTEAVMKAVNGRLGIAPAPAGSSAPVTAFPPIPSAPVPDMLMPAGPLPQGPGPDQRPPGNLFEMPPQ